MTARYSVRTHSVRTPVAGTAFIASNGLLGQGRVLNLSVPGCLLETNLHLHVRQAIALHCC